jgi:hypothetical protein
MLLERGRARALFGFSGPDNFSRACNKTQQAVVIPPNLVFIKQLLLGIQVQLIR